MSTSWKVPSVSGFAVGDIVPSADLSDHWVFSRAKPYSSGDIQSGIYIDTSLDTPKFLWVNDSGDARDLSSSFIGTDPVWRMRLASNQNPTSSDIELIYQSVDWRKSLSLPKLSTDSWSLIVTRSGFARNLWLDGPCVIADRGVAVALMPAGINGWIRISSHQLQHPNCTEQGDSEKLRLDPGLWMWNSLKKMVASYFELPAASNFLSIQLRDLGLVEAICLAALRSCLRDKTLIIDTPKIDLLSPHQKRLIENIGAVRMDTICKYHPQIKPRTESISTELILANLDDAVARMIALHLNQNLDVIPRNFISA